MKNKKKVIGNTVFFFALFGLTAYAVLKGKELSELAEVLKSVKPAYYIAGLIMIVVFVCCESYIIYRMLRLLHYNDVPKRNCVKYSFVGFFFSCITPSATGGQPMQLYYMNRDKVDISVGTVILMIVTILYKFVLDSLLSVFLIAQGRFLQVRKLHRIVKRIPVPTRSTNITGPHTKASTSDMILLNISISPL